MPTEGPLTAATTDGTILCYGTTDGAIVALGAADGRTRWTDDLPTEVTSPPAIAGDLVVARDLRGHVVATDVETGEHRWTGQYDT